MSVPLNQDGTRPEKKKRKYSYTSTWKTCPHNVGYYFNVKFLFWTLRLYWCDLCHNPYQAKFIKALLREDE